MSKIKKIIVGTTLLANIIMMLFALRQGFVIRADGAAGMIIFWFKIFLVSTAFSAFLANIFCTLSAAHDKQYGRGFWLILIFLTAVLFSIFLIFLLEACADEAGYCRQQRLFFQ